MFKSLMLGTVLAVAASATVAAPVAVESFVAVGYEGDNDFTSTSNHAFTVLDSMGTLGFVGDNDFLFLNDSGRLTFYEDSVTGDKTAQLTGTITNETQTFELFMEFSDFRAYDPAADLKCGAAGGGKADACNGYATGWDFYDTTVGSLTGLGADMGLDFTLAGFGAAFQFGLGANDKNLLLGASGWQTVTVTSASGATGHSDINISVLPEPGTLAILGLGLAGLAGVRRRSK